MTRMLRPSLILVLATLSLPALAQIYTYKDETGRTIVSDKPPAGKTRPPAAKPVEAAPAAAPVAAAQPAAAKTKAGVDPELEKRGKELAAKTKAEELEKEKLAKEENALACTSHREYLQGLESGERIARTDAKGERYFLDDAQRAKELASTRKYIADRCSAGK